MHAITRRQFGAPVLSSAACAALGLAGCTDAVIAVVQNTSMFESIDQMKGCTFVTMNDANAAPLLNTKFKEMGFSEGTDKVPGSEDRDVQFDTWRLMQFDSY